MLLDVFQTRKLLDKYRIPTATTRLCKDFGGVLEKATELSFPLVLKVSSTDASHKTERGLVQLGIHSLDELSLAFKQIEKKSAGLKVDAYILQEQFKGVELIIGGKTDSVFGQTMLFGSGGILTELVGDYAIRVTPLTKKDALQMIHETKAGAFVEGFRGRKVSETALVNLLLKTSELLEKEPQITELDFNPVMANEEKAVVVDARVVVK